MLAEGQAGRYSADTDTEGVSRHRRTEIERDGQTARQTHRQAGRQTDKNIGLLSIYRYIHQYICVCTRISIVIFLLHIYMNQPTAVYIYIYIYVCGNQSSIQKFRQIKVIVISYLYLSSYRSMCVSMSICLYLILYL